MAILTDKQRKDAERAAEEVIDRTFGGINAVEFPIDLNAVLEKYGLILKRGDFEDETISGAFSREDATIYVANSESAQGLEYIVAFELGHFILHKAISTDIVYAAQVTSFDDNPDKDRLQAHCFAANLLMPKEAVLRMLKVTDDLEQLGKIFDVTKITMSQRLRDLGF